MVTTTFVRFVTPGYLEALGVKLGDGRTFTEADRAASIGDASEPPIIINEALAKKYFDGANPVGRRVTTGFGPRFGRIIGVVKNVAEGGLTDTPEPARYMLTETLPFMPGGEALVFRTAGRDAEAALEDARKTIRRVAPGAGVAEGVDDGARARYRGGSGASGDDAPDDPHAARTRTRRRRRVRRDLALRQSAQPRLGRPHCARHDARARGSHDRHAWDSARGGRRRHWHCGVLRARTICSVRCSMASVRAIPSPLLSATAVLFVVGILAAIIPGVRASRTDPAVVLREQ